MKRFWCGKCGNEAAPGPWPRKMPDGSEVLQAGFTQIDGNKRYDLGHCKCTPDEMVELVNDPIVAELNVIERLDRFQGTNEG